MHETNVAITAADVTASGTWEYNVPRNAVDGIESTKWIAGGGLPQQITIQLAQTFVITRIELVVEQTPERLSHTRHQIMGGPDLNHLVLLRDLNAETKHNETIDIHGPWPDIKFIQICIID